MVIHHDGTDVEPLPAVLLFAGVLLKEDDVRGDIGERVLPKGEIRQTNRPQKVSLFCDMLTNGAVHGIHEVAAHHKGGYASLAEQTDGLGQKIVVDGELLEFGKLRIVQRLSAERRIAYHEVDAAGPDLTVLKTGVAMCLFGVEILRYGRRDRIKLYRQKAGLEVFGTKTDKVADTGGRLKHTEAIALA